MTGERQLDLLEHVASFSVEPRDFFDSGYLPHPLNGPVLIRSQWDLRADASFPGEDPFALADDTPDVMGAPGMTFEFFHRVGVEG